MNAQKIDENLVAYYDPSSPDGSRRPGALNARLIERVEQAFWRELGGEENFHMLFMHHVSVSPFFAVGIGSEWMVRVEAARLALAAAVSAWGDGVEDVGPGFSGGIHCLLRCAYTCI
jgi:hypothetical protein